MELSLPDPTKKNEKHTHIFFFLFLGDEVWSFFHHARRSKKNEADEINKVKYGLARTKKAGQWKDGMRVPIFSPFGEDKIPYKRIGKRERNPVHFGLEIRC